ncbi:MAG: MATE family efflux transporter, partial [Fusobacteriaceae bacterium]
MKKSKVNLLKGDMTFSLLKLTYPILLANVFQTLYSLIDAYFIGKVGGVQMASFFYVIPIISVTLAFGQGIGIAGTTLISIALGRGDKKDIDENVEQFFMFSFYLSLVIGFFGYLFRYPILESIGTEGELLTESAKYMGI